MPAKEVGRSLAAARGHSFRQTHGSACNKPEPEEPPREEPVTEPGPPGIAPPGEESKLALALPSPGNLNTAEQPLHNGEASSQANTFAGQDVAVYAANKLRGAVLESPQRPTGLDVHDMVAVADRAIAAVSNGQGGVQVQRSATRERIRLSLGRNFSISASRAR